MDCVKMNLKQGEIFETSNWKKILAIFHTVFLWIVKGIQTQFCKNQTSEKYRVNNEEKHSDL